MRHLEGAFYRYVESVSKGSPFKTGYEGAMRLIPRTNRINYNYHFLTFT